MEISADDKLKAKELSTATWRSQWEGRPCICGECQLE